MQKAMNEWYFRGIVVPTMVIRYLLYISEAYSVLEL